MPGKPKSLLPRKAKAAGRKLSKAHLKTVKTLLTMTNRPPSRIHWVSLGYSLDQRLLALAQLHVEAIHALGFQNFVQTNAHQNNIRLLGQNLRIDNQLLIGCRIRPGIARCESCDPQSSSPGAIQEIVQPSGVDLGGAGTLVSGGLGEVADDGNGVIWVKGQNAVVFKQDDGTLGALPGDSMVGFHIEELGSFGHGLGTLESHLQELSNPLVDLGFGDLSGFHMGQQTNTTRDLFRLFGHSTAPPSVKM